MADLRVNVPPMTSPTATPTRPGTVQTYIGAGLYNSVLAVVVLDSGTVEQWPIDKLAVIPPAS